MQNVLDYLKELGIPFEVHTHEAVFTVDQARQHDVYSDFGENKNLFLRNRKGDKHYLVTIAAAKQLDLKKLAEALGEKGLSFASPDRLMRYLGLTPGSVSPFGLINDVNKEVPFILDEDLLKHEYLGFHPNINTQTVVLKTDDFKKYLNSLGISVSFSSL